MSNENRTSLRITTARQKKLKDLKSSWHMPSNDETIGFLLDIADAEKMGSLAQRHVAKLRVAEQREAQKRDQVAKAMASLSEEQIAKLISGELTL